MTPDRCAIDGCTNPWDDVCSRCHRWLCDIHLTPYGASIFGPGRLMCVDCTWEQHEEDYPGDREDAIWARCRGLATVNDVAEILRVDRRRVLHWLRSGELEAHRPGRGRIWHITREAVDQFMRQTQRDNQP